jgi:hypothetical protein
MILKCVLCFLIVAQAPVASSSESLRTHTALPDNPHRDLESFDSSTTEVAPSTHGSVGSGNTSNDNPAELGRQTKRMWFIVPNFHAVSADAQLPPSIRSFG